MVRRPSGGREPAPRSLHGDDVEQLFLPWKESAPLAARMRPRTLEEYVGQDAILGPGKLLRRAIEADRIGSIILWGPPGSGKTTLARVIAGATSSHFETLNAVLAGVKDIREVVARARDRLRKEADLCAGPRRTTLFVDEVHRFNKAQQDALLPHVETGTIIFVGATTENPYFEVIKALVSRSRIFQLERLTNDDLHRIARAALEDPERGYGRRKVRIEDDALRHLVDVSSGDARNLLNALELAVETTAPDGSEQITVDARVAEESIQRRALLYDKDGDAHYDTISAFIKSLRGSDPDAALFWLARMLRSGEDPRFIARRLVIFASEDVGMADSRGLEVATAAAGAVEFVGLPECQWNLAHAVLYLATAPKSNSAIAYFDALRHLEEHGKDEVPDPLKDASRDREGLGHGRGYKYPHAYREHWVAQQYLPDDLQGVRFYQPGGLGDERGVRERVERWRALQDEGLCAERRLEGLSSGRARRRKLQLEQYGEARLRHRERLLDAAGIRLGHRVLDLGSPAGLIAWGALERAPLGHVQALCPDAGVRESLARAVNAEAVDRILTARVADPAALDFDDASFDRVIGSSVLYDRSDRRVILGEVARVLAPGGFVVLHEPLLGMGRHISGEIDLRSLGEELAAKVRAAEDAIYSDPRDPRMQLDQEGLAGLAGDTGLVVVTVERTLDTLVRRVTPEVIVQWFAGRRSGGRPSYEARLREWLSEDELAAFRRAVQEQLLDRKLHWPRHGVRLVAKKAQSGSECADNDGEVTDRGVGDGGGSGVGDPPLAPA